MDRELWKLCKRNLEAEVGESETIHETAESRAKKRAKEKLIENQAQIGLVDPESGTFGHALLKVGRSTCFEIVCNI